MKYKVTDDTCILNKIIHACMRSRTRTKSTMSSYTNQRVELAGPAGDVHRRGACGRRRLYVAPGVYVLRPVAHRHAHLRHEEVHYVTYHSTHDQRINVTSHGYKKRGERLGVEG